MSDEEYTHRQTKTDILKTSIPINWNKCYVETFRYKIPVIQTVIHYINVKGKKEKKSRRHFQTFIQEPHN